MTIAQVINFTWALLLCNCKLLLQNKAILLEIINEVCNNVGVGYLNEGKNNDTYSKSSVKL